MNQDGNGGRPNCGRRRGFYGSVLIFILALLAFFPALRGGWIWDDNPYVVSNDNLTDAAGLGRIWTDAYSNEQFYPLVFTTFWIENHFWGLKPFGFHLDNVLLHAASAILLWRLLIRLELPVGVAWLAAAIFAVHPVEVESVAWISERKNVLCGFFYLSAMLVYLKSQNGVLRGPERRSYLAAWLLFLCSLFAKTVASTWPAAVLVLIWWKNGRIRSRDVWPLLPFFAVGFFLSSITRHLEIYKVGARGKRFDFSVADRCIIAGRAIWFYAGKAVWPVRLAFNYPRWNLHEGRVGQAAVAASAALVLIGLIFLARRISRGPAAAGLLFAGTLAPALGFLNFYPMRYSFVADHFQYLAIIALIVPMAVVFQRLAGKWAFGLIVPLAVLTWNRCLIYHDPITFWSDAISQNSESWMAHVNLGQQLEDIGDHDRAGREYQIATAINPTDPEPRWRLALFQFQQHKLQDAEQNLRQVLIDDPEYPRARHDLEIVIQDEQQSPHAN